MTKHNETAHKAAKKRALQMYAEYVGGETLRQVAERWGITVTRVAFLFERYSLERRRPGTYDRGKAA